MFNFAGWLGQNSKQGKTGRLLREIQNRMRIKTSGDKTEIRLSYLPTLAPLLTKPLVEGDGGIETVIDLMDTYYLSREDWDSVLELGYQSLATDIPSKTRSGFTRTYNKTTHLSPFAVEVGGKKAKSKASNEINEMPDMEEVLEVDDEVGGDDSEEEAVVVKLAPAKKAPSKAKKVSKKKV
jgi:replication factor C subunit 1